MKIKSLYIWLLVISASLLTACSGSDDEPTPPSGEPARRTVLVYMEADNSLRGNAASDLDEIKQGAKKGLNGCRIVIYYSDGQEQPKLMEILADGSERVLKTYPEDASAVTVNQMRQVVNDAKLLAPASDYGLILWSHATGWFEDEYCLPVSASSRSAEPQIQPLWYGAEGQTSGYDGDHMTLPALAKALSGNRFSFIYFDCCHMATVEVAYELRDLAPVMVASATELGVNGMPYDQNLACFTAATPDLERALNNTFRYYQEHFNVQNDRNRFGCSITLMKTAALDRLASSVKNIMAQTEHPAGYSAVRYFRTAVIPAGIYDLKHYIEARCASNPTLLSGFQTAYSQVVALHRTTASVYTLPADDFNGLGSHILDLGYTPQQYGYSNTAWYNAVY